MMLNDVPPDEDRPISVTFDATTLRVFLQDGREIATPLEWYPRLLNASDDQRRDFELSAAGIHWESLDEDISVAGMLRGVRPSTSRRLKSPTT